MAVALNLFAFIYIAFRLNGSVEARWPASGAGLIGIFILFYFIRRKLKPGQQFRFSFPLFFALFTWIQLNNYWLAAAVLILIVLEELSKKPLVIKFGKEKISYPSLFKTEVEWPELNNVILKDNLLTMDFKNNKLLQGLITNEVMDEKAFNDFCWQQLSAQQSIPQIIS